MKSNVIDPINEANDRHDEILAKLEHVEAVIDRIDKGVASYLGNSTALTRLFTGQKVFVNTNDVSEAPHLILDGYWERDITKAFLKLVRPGDTVFDAGSTFGYYGLIAGAITNSHMKRGSIHFFDPNPVYEPFVKKSLMVNGLIDDAKVNTLGISADNEPVVINEFKDDWNSNTTVTIDDFKKYRQLNDDYVSRTIDTITIDKYCQDNSLETVDLIKIDIEGMEEQAYAGAKNIIAHSPNLKLVIEFTPETYKDPGGFFKQISKDFGFLATINTAGSLVPLSEYDQLMHRLRDSRWAMLVASKGRV